MCLSSYALLSVVRKHQAIKDFQGYVFTLQGLCGERFINGRVQIAMASASVGRGAYPTLHRPPRYLLSPSAGALRCGVHARAMGRT